tara:strand:+ start:387 stop:1664 length:1278 start_codon:yes stop_codon:yes gene_type:complete
MVKLLPITFLFFSVNCWAPHYPSWDYIAYTDQIVTADNVITNNVFGWDTALDGNTAVIGAPKFDEGSIHVFERIDNIWTHIESISSPDWPQNDSFGKSVSIEGDTIAVGAPGLGNGSVYIFEKNNTNWVFKQKLSSSDGAPFDNFGNAISINDDTLVIGAYFDDDNGFSSGSAYIFERLNGVWEEQQKLLPKSGYYNNHFGRSLSLDNDYLIIGSPGYLAGAGAAYIFKKNNNIWEETDRLTPSSAVQYAYFGTTVDIENEISIVGAWADNSAFIFSNENNIWIEKQKIVADDAVANDSFGSHVSIESDIIVVGASRNSNNNIKTGSAYIFAKESNIWEQKQKLITNDGSQDDYFGQSISIENGTILIGAPYADDESNSDSGSSYFYTIPQIDIIEEQIPAMSGIGLLALGLSMLGLGAVRLRKK